MSFFRPLAYITGHFVSVVRKVSRHVCPEDMGQVGHTGIEGSVIPANLNFLHRGAKITKYVEGLERVFLHVRVHLKKTKIH